MEIIVNVPIIVTSLHHATDILEMLMKRYNISPNMLNELDILLSTMDEDKNEGLLSSSAVFIDLKEEYKDQSTELTLIMLVDDICRYFNILTPCEIEFLKKQREYTDKWGNLSLKNYWN